MRMTLLLVCFVLGACSRDPAAPSGSSAAAKLLSQEEARQVGMHVLLNRYPQAKIVSENGDGRSWSYRFSTNGTLVPEAVVVDRKAGKARFERVGR